MDWYHVVWNTLGSWLPGDTRGFRNREHRIHSSGDYKHPPPKGEHAGLLQYNLHRSRPVISLARELREPLGSAILECFSRREISILSIAVNAQHVHVLLGSDRSYEEIRAVVGKCKTISSAAVRSAMPGSIWSRGSSIKHIQDRDHQLAAFHYITEKQEAGAWVWDFQLGGRRQGAH